MSTGSMYFKVCYKARAPNGVLPTYTFQILYNCPLSWKCLKTDEQTSQFYEIALASPVATIVLLLNIQFPVRARVFFKYSA
jgi:hypothetical protein